MSIVVSDYVSVRSRAKELGLEVPDGIAIVPEKFASAESASQLLHRAEAATIRTLFRNNGLSVKCMSGNSKYIHDNSLEWVGPILFIGASAISDNQLSISLAIGVLSNYLTDFFKGIPGINNVKLSIVVEKQGDRSCKKIDYDGPVDGLNALADLVNEVSHGREMHDDN